jgi:predicted GNAT family N-acyltransferase
MSKTIPPFLLEIARLRARAWGREDAACESHRWIDEWDEEAHHHMVYRDGQLAAAMRFALHASADTFPHPELYGDLIADLPTPIAWFSRLVVDPAWRGQRLSSGLDLLAAIEPFDHGANSIVATGGSVASNKFRHDVMLKFGWTLLGTANEVIDLPIEDAKPPRVYARIMGQIE